jgi:murein DD-endopeptidase MepM/ murein hydrolase activator NlpD
LESLAPSDDATTAELALTARGTTDTAGAASAAGGTGGSVLDAATAGVLPVAAAGGAPSSVVTATAPSAAPATGGTSSSAAAGFDGQVTSLTKAAQRAAAAASSAAAAQEAAARPEYAKPAAGRFTSGFGARWGRSHQGVDIAGPIGTPIVSVADGEVIESGPASGFGMWVRVQLDDGTVNVYGHVNRSYVREGQRVRAGEEIAEIGNRGHSTGPHLHFEVWLDGSRKVNPLPWLAERGISLGSTQD